MKKLFVVILTIVLILSSVGICYGAVGDNMISPYFVSVNYYLTQFNISSSGNATYAYDVVPRSYLNLNRVVATVKIINSDTGAVAYNKTKELDFDAMQYAFMDSGTYDLDTRGTYELRIMLKCYKDNTLLETINTTPDVAAF